MAAIASGASSPGTLAGRLGEDLKNGRYVRLWAPGTGNQRAERKLGGRFAAIPCFTQEAGSTEVGRTRRQCSKEYQTDVIERAIRRDVLGLAPRKRIPKGAPRVSVLRYLLG